MRIWYDVATVGGLIPAVAFIVLYLRIDGWRGTAIGRNLLAKAVVLAALFALSLVSQLWTPPAWVWLAITAALDAVLWQRLWILVRYQHRDHEASLSATPEAPGSTGTDPTEGT